MAWAPPVPQGYDDTHRAFLQAFMSRGTLTQDEARPILAAILSAAQPGSDAHADEDSISKDVFESYMQTARDALLPLDYDVRSTAHQATRQRVWALINTAAGDPTRPDLTTQLATAHSAEEIAFVKRLLDAMFETYNTPRMEVMAVTEAQALRVARPNRGRASLGQNGNGADEAAASQSADKGLKHSEVLALLPNLVSEGWLEKSREGFYSLAPRALLELWPWLNASYNDVYDDPETRDPNTWQRIKHCEACMEIVTVGQRCSERDCPGRLHDICLEAFFRAQKGRRCPKCKRPWEGRHFVGERAVTETEAFKRGRGGRGRRSDLVEAIMAQNRDDEEDDEEEVEA
jgi:hypothetical protein